MVLAGAVAAVALLSGPFVPSAAARDVTLRVRFQGALSVTWEGAADRGCAAAGTCGVSGSATRRLSQFDIEVDSSGSSSFGLPQPIAVRVLHQGSGGETAGCVDLLSSPFGALFDNPAEISEGQLFLAPGSMQLSSGRCAGPRPLDLVRALPSRILSVRAFTRRERVVDMSGSFPFVAGAFRGQILSSAKARVVRVRTPSDASLGLVDEGRVLRAVPRPKRRHAVLRLLYRAGPISGGLVTSFRGRPQPACMRLGACGTHGSSNLEVTARGGTVRLFTWRRQARGPGSKAALLRALRSGTSPVEVQGRLARLATRVNEAVTEVGDSCTDALFAGPPDFVVRRQRKAPRLSVFLRSFDIAGEADMLRARCPGPSQLDVLPAGVLARGTIALRDMGQRVVPVVMAPTVPAFSRGGYSGERTGGVPLTLRLVASDVTIERF